MNDLSQSSRHKRSAPSSRVPSSALRNAISIHSHRTEQSPRQLPNVPAYVSNFSRPPSTYTMISEQSVSRPGGGANPAAVARSRSRASSMRTTSSIPRVQFSHHTEVNDDTLDEIGAFRSAQNQSVVLQLPPRRAAAPAGRSGPMVEISVEQNQQEAGAEEAHYHMGADPVGVHDITSATAISDQRDKVDAVLEATALPANGDTDFTRTDESDGVRSIDRPVLDSQAVRDLAEEVSPAALFIRMVNEGNLIDIAAEMQKQAADNTGSRVWMRCANVILQADDNPLFHAMRVAMFAPNQNDASVVARQVYELKTLFLSHPDTPSGVNPDHISWDALSFKILPVGVEYFGMMNPDLLNKLTPSDFNMLVNAEKLVLSTIKEKAAQFRVSMNSAQSEFVEDASIYLEVKNQGVSDGNRQYRIAKYGRALLLKYIDKSQMLFAAGHLPQAIAPCKIYSCHDIISAAELRGSIAKLAQRQIASAASLVPNESVRARLALDSRSKAGPLWSDNEGASIMMKMRDDERQAVAYATMGLKYGQPMTFLQNKLAGSSNTLAQSLDLAQDRQVVNLSEGQKEIAKQQLSVLLACLRMRANATQDSDWELMTGDDLDHFEICKFLSRSDEYSDDGSGTENIYKLASTIQQSYVNGLNVIRFKNETMPVEVMAAVDATIQGRLKMLFTDIPLLSQDLREGGSICALMTRCIIASLCQRERAITEMNMRSAQRTIRGQRG